MLWRAAALLTCLGAVQTTLVFQGELFNDSHTNLHALVDENGALVEDGHSRECTPASA